jgi:glycine/D-amino acid oxidase-like deaminating enzyme
MPTELTSQYDLIVVGGGIVGLAVAREALIRQPGLRLDALFERGAANGVEGLEIIGPERLAEPRR